MKYLLAFLLATTSAFGATVTGPVGDLTGGAFNPRVEFWPLSTPLNSGNTNIVGPMKSVAVVSGNFSQVFVAGTYRVCFPPTTNCITIHVPNDTGTYSLAALSTNVSSVTGVTTTPAYRVKSTSADTNASFLSSKLVAGSNITITTNSAGQNETLTITAASGGATYTNNTGLPGVVVGSGIGTNLSTLATSASVLSDDTVVSNGIVTGLAAGSYAINEQALTGAFLFSSSNTLNVISSNFVTIVSNASGLATITFSGAGASARDFAMTMYQTAANPLVFTNGTTHGAYFGNNTYLGEVVVTNNTWPDAVGDWQNTAGLNTGGGFTNVNDAAWVENGDTYTPITVVTTEGAITYSTYHKVYGDGSGLTGVPTAAGVITNNWQSSAGQINLTNAIRPTSINMGYDYGISLNYRAGAGDNTNYIIITNGAINLPGAGNNGIYGTVSGIRWPQAYISWHSSLLWMLYRSGIHSMEHTSDFGHIRFGDDHQQNQLVKLAVSGVGETHAVSNAYSAMLGFHSIAENGYQGMSGIQGAHEEDSTLVYSIGGVNYSESALWFYSLIPEPKAGTNGGWGITDRGRAFLVGRKNGAYFPKTVIATNGIASFSTVTAASIAATGWTNIWSTNNATVYVERGASVSVTLKNRANATLNTFTAGTTPLTIALQPGWGFSASGNLSGNAVPF